jgi:hypothetical protein
VEDFLFDYYPFRPSLLQRWSPGHGVLLQGDASQKFLAHTNYVSHLDGGVWIDPEQIPDQRLNGLEWAIKILRSIETREPQYGCFGLHEWAMVYRAPQVRHNNVPLRMSPDDLATFVESQRVACSHYDAYRFFTPEARPLNQLRPEKGQQPDWEQAGCLHVNMDLYKWAYKFYPWVPSELVADCFEFAKTIREVDMRASPYDLQNQGYAPIRIETPVGRREYEQYQRSFTEQARPIRERLLACLEVLWQARLLA